MTALRWVFSFPVDTSTGKGVVLVLRKSKFGKGTCVHLPNAGEIDLVFRPRGPRRVVRSVIEIQNETSPWLQNLLFPDIPSSPYKHRWKAFL